MPKLVNEILKEEIDRLKIAEKSYLREIGNLPKGSIQKKRIKGAVYLYLLYRQGRKVKTKYLGKRSDEEIKVLAKKIELRREYMKKLREIKKNIKEIIRMVYGKRRSA